MIEIYTDGSCLGNGKETNIGGFGIAVLIPEQENLDGFRLDYYESVKAYDTTNNRMELEALIKGIKLALSKYKDYKCIIYLDSLYCVNICQDWIWKWAENGWLNSKQKTVENIDLIYKLYEVLTEKDFPNYIIKKVPGHADIVGNELADALAKNDRAKFAKILQNHEEVFDFTKFLDF